MQNFDDLEKLWREQPVAPPPDAGKVRAAQVAVERDANRYGRILKWGLFVVSFGILFDQLLAVVNYVRAGWAMTPVGLAQHVLGLALQIVVLLILLRRYRAHGVLLRKSAASVRENLSVALALVEREMHHYRTDIWALPLFLLLPSASLVDRFWLGRFDAVGLAGRLAFIWGLGLIFGVVALRHYWCILRSQRQKLTELLRDLDEV